MSICVNSNIINHAEAGDFHMKFNKYTMRIDNTIIRARTMLITSISMLTLDSIKHAVLVKLIHLHIPKMQMGLESFDMKIFDNP